MIEGESGGVLCCLLLLGAVLVGFVSVCLNQHLSPCGHLPAGYLHCMFLFCLALVFMMFCLCVWVCIMLSMSVIVDCMLLGGPLICMSDVVSLVSMLICTLCFSCSCAFVFPCFPMMYPVNWFGISFVIVVCGGFVGGVVHVWLFWQIGRAHV